MGVVLTQSCSLVNLYRFVIPFREGSLRDAGFSKGSRSLSTSTIFNFSLGRCDVYGFGCALIGAFINAIGFGFKPCLKLRGVSSDERVVGLSARQRDAHKWLVCWVECGMVCGTLFLVSWVVRSSSESSDCFPCLLPLFWLSSDHDVGGSFPWYARRVL